MKTFSINFSKSVDFLLNLFNFQLSIRLCADIWRPWQLVGHHRHLLRSATQPGHLLVRVGALRHICHFKTHCQYSK